MKPAGSGPGSGATDAAEGLYRVVDAAYEKRSIAISSNLHTAGFDELMPKTLATATVDRLLHHAHVCQTSGDSIRLTQALAGKGVTQLNSRDPTMANPAEPSVGGSVGHHRAVLLATGRDIYWPPAGRN
jgi:hypothetical protein